MPRKPVAKAVATITPEQVSGMSLSAIARFIARDWPRPYFGSVPYIEAMLSLESLDENFGFDSAREIVQRFLANAQTYRGPDARVIKAELNTRLRKRGAA